MPESPPPSPTASWSGALVDRLERQHALVVELSTLAERQAALVEARETDALLGLLARRQHLIERLSGEQEALGGLTADLESRRDGLDEGTRRRITSLIDEIGAGLARVMQRDEDDQRALGTARNEASGALGALGAGQRARSAYRDVPPVTTRFADRRG